MERYLEVFSLGRWLVPCPLEPGTSIIMGRLACCDIVVPDRQTSRQQLRFDIDSKGRVTVEDLGGKNPVHVNDVPMESVELHPGDRIEVGSTTLLLRRGKPQKNNSSVSFVLDVPSDDSNRVTVDAETVTGLYHGDNGRHQKHKLEAFNHLVHALARASDQDVFLGQVLDVLFEAFPADRGFIALGIPGQETLHPVRVRNDRGERYDAIEMSETILNEINERREACLFRNAARELACNGDDSVCQLGIHSFMCAPIIVDDFMGVLYLDHMGSECHFEKEDLIFLQGIAHVVGLALDNLHYHEELDRDRVDRLQSVFQRDGKFVGKSAPMLEVMRRVSRLGKNDSPVLILGENGTGKEVVARTIHSESSRRDGPFVAFNCATGGSELIESELFGHVAGAFTDARSRKKGKFELADGGTLFLDEIGDMPLATQAKVLRAIQFKSIEPIGSEKSIEVDIRIISATNKNLVKMRKDKTFRDDLYYRLAVLTQELPPLRDRGDDVIAIAEALLPDGMKIDKTARKALLAYEWKGNVRELQNVIAQACFNTSGDVIRLRDLPREVAKGGRHPRLVYPLCSLARNEAKHIRHVLHCCNGVRTRAAEILEISREGLHQKMKRYGIT